MTEWNHEDGCHGIHEEASVEIQGITRMWSLLPETDNPHNTFLVLGFTSSTSVLSMNLLDCVLEEIEIEGFNSAVGTLYCHYAVHDQLVQVTKTSVRLVDASTRKLRYEWQSAQVQAASTITYATCNATQVLLAIRPHLVYLEIGDGILNVVKAIEMDNPVSCLDISPVGDNPHRSQIAAVGTWLRKSARIYSLPELVLLKEEPLGDDLVPHFVLMCSFDEIPHLFCGFNCGRLVKFVLNTSNGSLMNKEEQVFTGTMEIMSICLFSSYENSKAFAVSNNRPTVMYIRNNEFSCKDVNLNVQVEVICSLHTAAFPYRLAIFGDDKLMICSIDEVDDGLISQRP